MYDFTSSTSWTAANHSSMLSSQELFLSVALFLLFSKCLLFPPQEFVSAGLTIEHIFSNYLGDPLFNVIEYQARKIIINRAFVGSLPFLLSLFIFFFHENAVVFTAQPTSLIHYFAHVSVLILIGALSYALYHHFTQFKTLTAIKNLTIYSSDVPRLSIDITNEYRNFLNFTYSVSHSCKFVVSDNWVLYATPYDFTVINLNDVTFETFEEENYQMSVTGEPVQFLRIRAIIGNNLPIPTFCFRINSNSYRDLQGKLADRLITRDVILLQTVHERFVLQFIDKIAGNPKHVYSTIDELEPCFGCSIEQPNVKLVRNCIDQAEEGVPNCQNCYCRPMWCVACMARIFASKQEQDQGTQEWISGKSACPTCRAPFCVDDVSFVVKSESDA